MPKQEVEKKQPQSNSTSPKDQNTEEYSINVGDTIAVNLRIQEENRSRIQKYEGIVIAQKGSGKSKTITVRRIGVNDIGVERIFPLYSPNITGIDVVKRGKARRAKLYYLRDRKGRAATYVKSATK